MDFSTLTQDDHKKIETLLFLALFYYADPGNYFALDIRKEKGTTPGDMWHDFGDDVTGPYASSIKPGEFARHAFNALRVHQGEQPIDWNTEEISIAWHAYAEYGIDLDARANNHREHADKEYEKALADEKARRAALPEFETYDCCSLTSENAVHVEFDLIEDPTRTDERGNPEKAMPMHCPTCTSPPDDGSGYQPNAKGYICGARAHKCGHIYYRDKSLCDYYASLLENA